MKSKILEKRWIVVGLNLILRCVILADEQALLDMVTGNTRVTASAKLLEAGESGPIRNLKPVIAFGESFSGKAALESENLESLNWWSDRSDIKPAEVEILFSKLKDGLTTRLGGGEVINNIPNFEDSSEVESKAVLWFIGSDVIMIRTSEYSNRAGMTLLSGSRGSWESSMGADEKVYWLDVVSKVKIFNTFVKPAGNAGRNLYERDRQNLKLSPWSSVKKSLVESSPLWFLLVGGIGIFLILFVCVRFRSQKDKCKK